MIDKSNVETFERTMRKYSFKRKVNWNYFESDMKVFHLWDNNWMRAYGKRDSDQKSGLMNIEYYQDANWADFREGDFTDNYFYNPVNSVLGN